MSFGVPGVSLAAGSSVQVTPNQGPNPTPPKTMSVAGVPSINGTQTYFTYNVPADGKQHFINIQAYQNVTVLEAGGTVTANVTTGGTVFNLAVFSANQAVGTYRTNFQVACDPGSQLVLSQSAALTSGAATVSLWIADLISV